MVISATGISGGAAAEVPGAFFKSKWGNQLDSPKSDFKRKPDEKLGDVDCYVLTPYHRLLGRILRFEGLRGVSRMHLILGIFGYVASPLRPAALYQQCHQWPAGGKVQRDK